MNERIKEILEASGMKKIEFANAINVHQSYVTRLVSGEKKPSDRLIEDICEKITINNRPINKEWLLSGKGEMVRAFTKTQEIGDFISSVMKLPDESFKKKFIHAIQKLDENDWKHLETIANKLLNEKED